MKRFAFSVLVSALALVTTSSALAQIPDANTSPSLEQLFTHRATVTPQGSGLVRVPLSAEALAVCRRDLGDIRVIQNGTSVPFAIDPETPWSPPRSFVATVQDIEESRRRDGVTMIEIETYTLAPLASTRVEEPEFDASQGQTELYFNVREGVREFVRTVTIESLDDNGDVLRTLAETTLFRLAAPRREKTRVLLPHEDSRRIRVRITGEGPALHPVFYVTERPHASEGRTLSIPLAITRTVPGAEYTELHVALPGAWRPNALHFEAIPSTFHRRVTVHDASRARDLADGAIFRVPDFDEAQLRVPIERPSDATLLVRVYDADAGALEGLQITAEVQGPALIFSSYGDPVTVHFGAPLVTAPNYSIGGHLLTQLERLRAEVPTAPLGPVEANPAHRDTPPLAFAHRPGAPVRPATFSHRQAIVVPDSPSGLVRVRLHPSYLAALQPDLHDLRVIDGEGRQWAYILTETNERAAVMATVTRVASEEAGHSRYEITSPHPELPIANVSFEVAGDLFDRPFVLRRPPSEEEQERARRRSNRWAGSEANIGVVREDRLTHSPTRENLSFDIQTRATTLELTVDDGGEQPLDITGVALHVDVPFVLLPAPAGRYELLAGDDSATYPSYDITHAEELLGMVTPADVDAPPAEANPDYAPPRAYGALSGTLLWVVILIAVLALLGLTIRLVKTDEPETAAESESGAAPAPSAAEPPPSATETTDTTASAEASNTPSDPDAP